MLEGLAGAAGAAFLLWLMFSDSGNKKGPRFEIKETQDPNYFKVWDYDLNKEAFIGTEEQCRDYISKQY